MVRLREVSDETLRETLREMIAESRGMAPAMIPDWWEMDDADLSEMLIEMRYRESPEGRQREHEGDNE